MTLSPATTIVRARAACLRWYDRRKRDLPWRHERDPYAIWVSEIMLQQTRADVVATRWPRFMQRFADVRALAAARESAVVQEWAGLGYYARARNLHAAARIVVRDHGGRVPHDAGLEALPGIGRYTAGAIRSIAWDEPAPILDGNVARVFARLFGADGDTAADRRQQWDLAATWAQCARPGDANQALMELGATVCTKPQPACERCPVQSHCFARRTGRQRDLPRPRRRPRTSRLQLAVVIAVAGSRILLVRRRAGHLLRDFWELPTLDAGPGDVRPADDVQPVAARHVADRFEARLGIRLGELQHTGRARHAILQHVIDATVWVSEIDAEPPQRPPRQPAPVRPQSPIPNLDAGALDARWVAPSRCRALPLSTLTRKSLHAAAAQQPRWERYLPNSSRDESL